MINEFYVQCNAFELYEGLTSSINHKNFLVTSKREKQNLLYDLLNNFVKIIQHKILGNSYTGNLECFYRLNAICI